MNAVTARAVVLGGLGAMLCGVWVAQMERVYDRTRTTTASLFFTAVVLLALLAWGNALIRRRAPRLALSQGELLVVYGMLSVGTAMGAVDLGSALLTLISHPHKFATPDNGWMRFTPYLPSWLTVNDPVALKAYYEGSHSFWEPRFVKAWGLPLAMWAAFVLTLLYGMSCINALLRTPWMQGERLAFPIVQLPLALTEPENALAKNRLFWLGFTLAAFWSLLSGLNYLWPSFPAVGINGFDVGQWFPQPPWSAIGYQSGKWLPVGIYPFVIGLGYLLPKDLLFSCWFFFLLTRVEQIATNALGWQAEGSARYPYLEAQAFGAYTSVFFFAMLGLRRHLKTLWQSLEAHTEEASEARRALLGLALSGVLLVGFGWLAGLPPIVSVTFFLVYFIIAIAVTRMRAELGPPTHDLHFIGPSQTLYHLFGSESLGPRALITLTLFYWFNRAYRSHPMPHLLETDVVIRSRGGGTRGLTFALLLAALLGLGAFCITVLHQSYVLGAAAKIRGWAALGYGNEAYGRLVNWLSLSAPPDRREVGGMGVGFALATVITLLRQRIVGFPLHAFGYALAGGWSMVWSWLSLFVAWGIKVALLRYGGLRAWRLGVPLAFGVILGDFVMGAIWSLFGIGLDIPVYSYWNG